MTNLFTHLAENDTVFFHIPNKKNVIKVAKVKNPEIGEFNLTNSNLLFPIGAINLY